MRQAPIALFVFRRAPEAMRLLHSLAACPEARSSDIVAFSDGPRSEDDVAGVGAVRTLLRNQLQLPRLRVVEREHNLGLRHSIVRGVSELCCEHDRAIILEDDLVVARGFLSYMNSGLERYANDDRVMGVSAHAFATQQATSRAREAVFLPMTSSWGWATWSRAWQFYEDDPRELMLLENPLVRRAFDLGGAYDYTAMLRAAVAGKVDSWAIRWWWSVFRRGGVCLVPLRTLVANLGVGAGATNTIRYAANLDAQMFDVSNHVDQFPERVSVDEQVFHQVRNQLRRGSAMTAVPGYRLLRSLQRRVRALLRAA